MAKILLVDDSQTVLRGVTDLLERAGHEVHATASVLQVGSLVVRLEPDLVLLDLEMPVLNGERILTILRGRDSTKNVPVVLFSSNSEDELRTMMAATKASGFLSKQLPDDELIAGIKRMLEATKT